MGSLEKTLTSVLLLPIQSRVLVSLCRHRHAAAAAAAVEARRFFWSLRRRDPSHPTAHGWAVSESLNGSCSQHSVNGGQQARHHVRTSFRRRAASTHCTNRLRSLSGVRSEWLPQEHWEPPRGLRGTQPLQQGLGTREVAVMRVGKHQRGPCGPAQLLSCPAEVSRGVPDACVEDKIPLQTGEQPSLATREM